MSPEEREKKRLWMEEYNRRRKASVTKTAQADLDASTPFAAPASGSDSK